jgi:hypothetical protein
MRSQFSQGPIPVQFSSKAHCKFAQVREDISRTAIAVEYVW